MLFGVVFGAFVLIIVVVVSIHSTKGSLDCGITCLGILFITAVVH